MARSKKSLKKIQSLVFIMLITIVLGITATYAWFSTQRDVEIAGMRLNVEVAESLQISLDGEIWSQSINIADMRQFYGTYQETGEEGFAVYQAKKVADGGNENYVPTELLPVSTAGEVANGKLKFVQGTVGTNVDGTQSLTGITACSETDITTDADIDDKEDNNADHPYFVFDMYLRNISAKTTGVDELKLNRFSRVDINYVNQQEGRGKSGTGLEYSARIGFVIYGNTVSVTAQDDATLGTVGEQIRGLTSDNTEVPAIWEPNDKEHTQYVVNNNGRGITSLKQAVTTYGIKSAIAEQAAPNNKVANVSADTDANGDGVEDTNANLVAVKTFKPAYTDVNTGTTAATVITDINGNNVGIEPNQISKVRVYIWLEGQDPDCVDMASTGDKISLDLKLTKDKTTLTEENSYAEGGGSGSGSDSSNGITAAQIYAMTAEEKKAIYGARVTNYESINETNYGANINWRIYHSDGSNIYLIAEDYVENTYWPTGKGGTPIKAEGLHNTTYGGRLVDIVEGTDYTGTADIASDIKTKLLSNYTYTSTEYNAKATAYLLDTNQWANFKDSNGYASFAVGAPTIELFAASYNATHPERTIDIDVAQSIYDSSYGYRIKWSDEADYSWFEEEGSISGISLEDDLYVKNDKTKASGYWVAAPSALGSDYMWNVQSAMSWGLVYASYYDDYGNNGVLPLVSLNSSVQIEMQEDGETFKIVE